MYKVIKRSFSVCTVALSMIACIPTIGIASPPTPPIAAPQTPILSVNDPQNYLHLTVDQQKKMSAIIASLLAKRNALAANTSMSTQQKQATFLTYVHETQGQIRQLLTPAQQAINSEHEAAAVKYRTGFIDTLKKAQTLEAQFKASLTPAQNKQVQAFGAQAKAQLTQLQGNASMPMAQKQQQAQMIVSSFNKQFDAILTPSQQEMVKQLNNYKQEAASLQRLAQSP